MSQKFKPDMARDILPQWFIATEGDILNRFANLSEKSLRIGSGDFESVFIPGTRQDRVLLVAHVDTVWNDSPRIEPVFKDGIFYSGNRKRGLGKKFQKPIIEGLGIGADDRAGCAILWELKELGHSLLLTGNEERGCLGSFLLMSDPEMSALMQDHQFAVQFDRHGKDDLVFYSVGSKKFVEYCKRSTNYIPQNGSYTDICLLCEDICGVNMSVGYKNEHTCNEVLSVRHWTKTLNVAHKWLSESNIPRFLR